VAVLEPGAEEPLLLRCASTAVLAEPVAAAFAPGLLDTSQAVACDELRHVAALDATLARLIDSADGAGLAEDAVATAAAAGGDDGGLVLRPVSGAGWTAEPMVAAERWAVEATVAAFERAGLVLESLDAAACAEATVADLLGLPLSSPLDPLAAVSVAPECEQAALALGVDLVVPVGLALARWCAPEGERA
jgi:hypothetical protein